MQSKQIHEIYQHKEDIISNVLRFINVQDIEGEYQDFL